MRNIRHVGQKINWFIDRNSFKLKLAYILISFGIIPSIVLSFEPTPPTTAQYYLLFIGVGLASAAAMWFLIALCVGIWEWLND